MDGTTVDGFNDGDSDGFNDGDNEGLTVDLVLVAVPPALGFNDDLLVEGV